MAVKSNGQLTVEDVSGGNTGCSGRTISGVQHGMSAVRAVEETRLSWSTAIKGERAMRFVSTRQQEGPM